MEKKIVLLLFVGFLAGCTVAYTGSSIKANSISVEQFCESNNINPNLVDVICEYDKSIEPMACAEELSRLSKDEAYSGDPAYAIQELTGCDFETALSLLDSAQ